MTKRRQTSDGRVMTQPELRINEGSLSPDTIFTVSGTSPWGSTSKYNVVLNGPNSYYTYKASQLETDENGDEIRSWVTKTGNDPKRLARYRLYVKEGEQANDYTSGWEDFLRAIGLKKKDGGWLDKFQDGGITLRQSVSPEQDVMNTIDAAIGEIQTKRPGQAVQKLAAMMQDPNYSMIIDMIKQEYPQIEGILNTVEQMVGAYKCGGKAKKKVKKGAKGCVPCKKLMKVGGKLINMLTDCEGNIISKHLIGGYLIPKGLVGLTAQFVQEPYRKAKASTDAGNANDVHYYLNDDNKIYMQTYVDGGWGAGLEADMNNFKNWVTTANTSGQILGKNFFVNGFNFDYNTNMGTMSKDDAQAAGIDVNQFKTSLGTRGKYEASYNPLFGESKPSEVAITQGYINSLGGMNAAVKHERQQRRKDRQAQRSEHRAYNSAARLSTKDSNSANDVNVLTSTEKQTNLNNIDTNYANEASRMAAAMKAKWANYNVGTPASATASSSVTNSKRDVLKQGGWLTKFLDGGKVKKYKDGEKVYRKATPYESTLASPSIYSTKEDNGYTLPAGYLAYATPDMWKWDVIAPTNIKFPLLKELIGYIPKTDAPIGRLIRTFNIEGMPNDTSYITHSKHPFKSIRYENIEKGEDGHEDFLQLFKSTLNE